jgi:hypothetical protein
MAAAEPPIAEPKSETGKFEDKVDKSWLRFFAQGAK